MRYSITRLTAFMTCTALGSTLGSTGHAAPDVVADIAPIHSLVAQVMSGVGEPYLLIPAAQDPHTKALRPSQAKELEKAEIVFWMGEDMSPWLEGTLDNLAGDAHKIEFLHEEVTKTLPFRDDAIFEDDHDDHDGHDDHKEEHDDHDEDHAEHKHDHDDHDDHKGHDDHDDHDGHDDHKEEHDDHDDHDEDHAEHKHDHDDHKDDHDEHDDHKGHDDHDDHKDDHDDHHHHGENDPHAWLDPQNAIAWLELIAEELSEHDPANAALYQENAKQGQTKINAVAKSVASQLAESKDKKYVVFHDAYQYFAESFGVPIVGSLAISDATAPSAARVTEIQLFAQENTVACAFAEPQQNTKILTSIFDGTAVQVATLDPLGATLDPSLDLYTNLLEQMARSILDCSR